MYLGTLVDRAWGSLLNSCWMLNMERWHEFCVSSKLHPSNLDDLDPNNCTIIIIQCKFMIFRWVPYK